MTKDEDDLLPDKDAAREFYAKYEPKEILGRGISSTVRKCLEKETGKEYAAKIIDISADPDSLTATREEIRILKLVSGHPYIIQLHDVFESTTFIFLVFEICKNGELFDYLTSVVTMSEKKTRTIMRQLFEAIQYIHSKRIVHRDLKPENILLDDNNNIKVTDFGFAQVLEGTRLLTDLCGTPGYLAPEVLKVNMYSDAKGYSLEVDIWACGVIMYTLLVGCPPFWHRKQIVMLRNIMEGKYSFDSPEWADISVEAKDLISKLLVVEPAKRLPVIEALEHPFFNVILWDQEMIPLKKSLAPTSRRLSVIEKIANDNKTFFDARKKFKYAIICVLATVCMNRLTYISKPISVAGSIHDPYGMKPLRKAIDNCAFRIYGHWVKKGEGQNRAALFEMKPKRDLKTLYMKDVIG